MKIPLIKPFITQEVKEKVLEVLDSGYLTEGPVTHEFEELFRTYIGCENAIAVTSCTTGLELALRCLNIGPGDEVIVPDYTYPATATVAPVLGAKSVLVDIDMSTMLIDYDALEAAVTEKTKAIIPVSLFGNPLNYERLNEIKRKYKLFIVEDAAGSIGAEFKRSKVGNLADISVFSLHPRKFITTGEGGMITTNKKKWADWMKSFKHFGMKNTASREKIVFERIGTNLKLSNVLAAIGLVQMRHIKDLLKKRIELSENYIHLMKSSEGIEIPETTADGLHSRQSFCVFIQERDRVMAEMRNVGIEVQIGTYALHQHPAFKKNHMVELHSDMKNSDWVFAHCLALPLYHDLEQNQQEYIVDQLNKTLFHK